jgi:tripartite-type tricarboxylate transporter receptor subunit TctC
VLCHDPEVIMPATIFRPLLIAIGAALGLAATAAQAAWPERPVTVMVPFTAGGITDVLARLMAERLQEALKEPFIVENAPGAAGVIAAERVLKAAPDGYTLLFTPVFQITMAPFTTAATFDPVRDFKPVTIVGTSPFVVTVGAAVPATTLPAFIAYAKARPGQIPFGSAGTGSLSHVSSAIFLKSAGLDMVHVPYRGLGSAFTDLIAGHISMVMATPVELKSYLDSGKIRPLAVTATTRSKQLPDVPTVSETLPSPPSITLNGLVAPRRTPQEIVDTLAREIIAAEKTPAFQERLVRIGVDPIVATPKEFAEIIAADTARWRDIVRELDLKPH